MTNRLSVVRKWRPFVNKGIDPFGKRFRRTAKFRSIKGKYSELDKEQLHELNRNSNYCRSSRNQTWKGKVGFAHLQDREGQIQIYVREDAVGEENYEIFKKTDLGDFLGVEGESCAQTWVNFRLKQLISLTCQSPSSFA